MVLVRHAAGSVRFRDEAFCRKKISLDKISAHALDSCYADAIPWTRENNMPENTMVADFKRGLEDPNA